MSAYYRVNFQISNNEDLRQAFALMDTASAPVNLTGAVLRMGIEAAPGTASIQASTANGRIVITDAAQGRFEVAIAAADISAMPPGSYRHDLLLTAASGQVQRVWAGSLTLQNGVTQ